MTIKELQEALAPKDPDAKVEILVQNNPDKTLTKRPPHVVILVADGDTLRLN